MEMSIEKLFLQILNMSITASYVIIFVIITRYFLKKAPKTYTYKRQPSFWVSVILITLCGIIGLGLLTNPREDGQDLSFLKPDNLLSTIAEKDRVPVKNHGGTTYLTPDEVISWIDVTDWKEKNIKSPYELSSDYTIVINEEPKQEIRLYESEPKLVMMIYGDKWRYYTIKKDNYDDLLFRVMIKSNFEPNEVKTDEDTDKNQTIRIQVEDYLNKIMSSRKEASNLGSYINEHQIEFESILKLGEPALIYMLSEFEKGNQIGLKGAIMKELCTKLLGNRIDNKDGTYNTAQEWYDNLVIQQEVKLPSFSIKKTDKTELLAYDAVITKYPSYPAEGYHGLCVVALKIHDTQEEGNKLRIFVTAYYESYRFYGNRLVEDSGGIVPTAITYVKDKEGNYHLEEYLESGDGAMWGSSIKAYCVTPISGKKIKGLAEKIIEEYSDHSELFKIEKENLKNYLITNQLHEVKVFDVLGNVKNID